MATRAPHQAARHRPPQRALALATSVRRRSLVLIRLASARFQGFTKVALGNAGWRLKPHLWACDHHTCRRRFPTPGRPAFVPTRACAVLTASDVRLALARFFRSWKDPFRRAGISHPRAFKIMVLVVFQMALLAALVWFALPPSRALCAPQLLSRSLRAIDGKLVDGVCHEVHLTGVNWFGMETDAFAPHGLEVRNWQEMLEQMAQAGFNTIRFPFSNQFFDPSSVPKTINYHLNPDLQGLQGLALLDRLIQGAGAHGFKVILDRHRPTAQAQSDLWYTKQVPESRWLADWRLLAGHYRGNLTVIGADLHNEPRGPATWGSGDPKTDWRLAAERAGNAILTINPDWLIIVEGIEHYRGDWYWWGGNLEGAAQFPVRLLSPDKLVYSIHDYGPEVYPQSWFWDPLFPHNLAAIWLRHWAFLPLTGQAPVLVGEFGARTVGQDKEGVWLRSLVAFMKAYGISYTYWAWNPDSWDTGGLLKNDWTTLDQAKLQQVAVYQAPPITQPVGSLLASNPGEPQAPPAPYKGGLPWADVPAPFELGGRRAS